MKKLSLFLLTALPSAMTFAGSHSVPFAIPGNQYCGGGHSSDMSISVSNLSSHEATIKLNLYGESGNKVNVEGTANSGIQSNIIPGTEMTIAPYTTVHYHKGYGSFNNAPTDCDRAYRGELTNLDTDAQIIASGWISGFAGNGQYYRSGSTIVINNGQKF
ncbi:hypothetical protein RND59_19655 [Vibrio ruber]|uniref:hypothetical protein n=1 Tax=Vibrio ruber TaxID=184755 RepID=UPI0028929FE3|nr:hypothetical protein [Vibrio ruber]WNJ97418.1 hypothetical protein RND59_19655 [Vibrio ruber]